MCGIVGLLGPPESSAGRSETVRRMMATLVHRGPDGEGFVSRRDGDFGFRRLAIVDVSAEVPPFANEDNTVWTLCNGEIYNYQELRSRLEGRGHRLRTSVDTEVIPHLYEEYGADLFRHLDGMFAFAVWDERKRLLLLGRDRAGEKPLYYWDGDGTLAFASELRALLANPEVPREVDPIAIRRYLTHDFFPAPLTPLAAVRKLPAGHFLTWRQEEVSVQKYWDLADYFSISPDSGITERQVAEQVDARIAKAVAHRKRSDVPVGVFLSGGIDSSAILAHLAEQEGPGVPAFGLGTTDPAFNEAIHARETAELFGAEFHQLILSEEDLEEGLRRVAEGFDEPLADASTIPTHMLSLFARQKVKVVLSGEGGDELFAGYPTYIGNRLAELYGRLPRALGSGLLNTARRITPVTMGNVGLDYLLGRFAEGVDLDRIERHHVWFGSFSPQRQLQVLSPRMRDLLAGDDPFASARARVAGKGLPDGLAELLYTDFTMYLQDDLLTKVDRASMLASLEARAPLLDHELAEYVAGLPSRLKLRGRTTKLILRKALARRLPREILQRRKRGFNIPFSRWLLHGLGERLKVRFAADRVEARGLFSPEGVTTLMEEHLSRRADHRKPLFNLLALDHWCDRVFGEGEPVPLAKVGKQAPEPVGVDG